MSDERLEELGIPRRRFLKRGAAAAFAAPVVVSFALDGVAEGDPARGPAHQTCANQSFPNQAYVEDNLIEVIRRVLLAVPGCEIGHKEARTIGQLAYDAAYAVAIDSPDMCKAIQKLIHEIKQVHNSSLKAELLLYARTARSVAGC